MGKNILTLNWRNRHQGKSEQCPACDCESVTLEHFLLDCPHYNVIKVNLFFLQQIQNRNNARKTQNILAFENQTIVEVEQKKLH